jgi:hypothetical protein
MRPQEEYVAIAELVRQAARVEHLVKGVGVSPGWCIQHRAHPVLERQLFPHGFAHVESPVPD